MKGQYLTVEYLFFFAFGIVIVISVFALFTNISDSIKQDSLTNQLKKTGELIRGNIVKSFISANSTNSIIYQNVTIPSQISKCLYFIQVKNSVLSMNCTDNYKNGVVLSLYGINVTQTNIVYSSRGILQITALPNVVYLG